MMEKDIRQRLRKTAFLFATIVLIAVCCVLFSSCDKFKDSSYKDEDYIEVQSLRFSGDNPTADIKMASQDEPSSYQLEVDVLPKNATNRALSYFIPSEYHQYVTVDKNGLLTAHKVSEGIRVPVVIRSTTNEKAKIEATVLVEDVEVKSITFSVDKLTLLCKDAPTQISVNYFPAHAIDGRNVRFTSQNDEIVTVSSSGMVTPVGVGYTHILANCTTSENKIIKNQLEVQVLYVQGQYQLEVTGSPKFNQVIGDYTPIEFTLLLLGEHVDANPTIKWYVDNRHIHSNDDKLQYTHIPDAQTEMSYRINVVIKPYQGDEVKLTSDPITVYQAFNGIYLDFDNQSSVYNSYRYGDTATFELNAGDASSQIVKYNWYISDNRDPTYRSFVGETSLSDKNLTRRINVSGDYILTVEAVNANDELVMQRTFDFSAEKLIEGDTLVVRPKLLDYGLPPKSYHWRMVRCDEDGNYDESDALLFDNGNDYQDTASDEVLYLPLKTGYFRFIVTATSDEGVSAQISQGGEMVPFKYVSDVIRVYSRSFVDEKRDNDLVDVTNVEHDRYEVTYFSAINDISVEGIGRGRYSVYLKWNSTEDIPSYLIEITKEDGSVLILDSEEKNSQNTYGTNFCYVSSNVLTLSDVFSVRVKQKRGQYSERFYYGTPNDKGGSDETHTVLYDPAYYGYFETIGYNNVTREVTTGDTTMNVPAINAYVSDMTDLQEILSFILLYNPTVNSYISYYANQLIDGKFYNEYVAEIYTAFDYSEELYAKYPYSDTVLTAEKLASYGDYADYAKMIYGALNVLPYGFDVNVGIEEGKVQGGIKITLDVYTNLDTLLKNTPTLIGLPSDATSYVIDDSDVVDTSNLPIDLRDEVAVRDSDELVYIVEKGYKPVPSGNESIINLYKTIKDIAVRIVDEGMSDEEKMLAFFDYIALNTVYDSAIEEERARATSKYNLYLFEQFRLEGVFYKNKAVDVGIAKAYSVLCGLYGINCVTVTGIVNGEEHAYNKVYVDGKYYVVDIGNSMFVIEGYSVVTHNLFMITDEQYSAIFNNEDDLVIYGDTPVADGDYDRAVVPFIRTQSELLNAVNRVKENGKGVYGVEIDFSKSTYIDLNTIKDVLRSVEVDNVRVSDKAVLYYSSNSTLRILVLIEVSR